MWTGLYKINILAPQLAADKEFEVYQGYLTIGGDLIYYYSRRDLLGYIEGSLGADYNQGISEVDSTDVTENVNRIKIRPSFQWQFWGKRSDLTLPPELDENF
ncbi:hypothetical protein [Pontibacter mangrovi]|uniref:Uncharacterized protein n=1 Tax=Pontibacter mangrovi TaxID=2589816 RepID=A0A501W7V4_9BACT|nr:hypothetical protein [Pontibacter mangrovi]TPE43331.1 hypothetical protein FJM65_14570 [Pontibacter mangrovi]